MTRKTDKFEAPPVVVVVGRRASRGDHVRAARAERERKATHGGARKGAGRKSNAERGVESRSESVYVRYTPSEYEHLRRSAEAAGLDLADFVRTASLAAS